MSDPYLFILNDRRIGYKNKQLFPTRIHPNLDIGSYSNLALPPMFCATTRHATNECALSWTFNKSEAVSRFTWPFPSYYFPFFEKSTFEPEIMKTYEMCSHGGL